MFNDETLSVALGASHTCALDSPVQDKQHNVHKHDPSATSTHNMYSNDLTRCWGWNMHGQTDHAIPGYYALNADKEVIKLAAGPANSCLIDSMFDLKCWGMNTYNQNDVPEWSQSNTRIKWESVGMGLHHSCGLDKGGDLRCWGGNDKGQIDIP